MNKVLAFLFVSPLILLGLCAEAVMAQTCPPGPPTSRYDGSTDGTALPNGGLQFNFEYAQLAGFDCFEQVSAWFPETVHSYSSISPGHLALDMAYAVQATATFSNVVVPDKANYTLAIRYAYNSGHFPGITDRPQGIKVNGVVISYDMHFPITYSFEDYEYSSILVPLNAGQNTIQVFNVSDHGVGRLDTMIITPSGNTLCSDPPTSSAAPGSLLASTAGHGVGLSWTGSTFPADCQTRYYDVYRSTSPGFVPSMKNRIASGLKTTSYTDTAVSCSTSYYYLVLAVDTAGASVSIQASARTASCSASLPSFEPRQASGAAAR